MLKEFDKNELTIEKSAIYKNTMEVKYRNLVIHYYKSEIGISHSIEDVVSSEPLRKLTSLIDSIDLSNITFAESISGNKINYFGDKLSLSRLALAQNWTDEGLAVLKLVLTNYKDFVKLLKNGIQPFEMYKVGAIILYNRTRYLVIMHPTGHRTIYNLTTYRKECKAVSDKVRAKFGLFYRV